MSVSFGGVAIAGYAAPAASVEAAPSLQLQIDAEQATVDADRTALNTAKATLAAAQAVPKAANSYRHEAAAS